MATQLYFRPPVNELVFQVFDRSVHPEFFEILATRTIRRSQFQLGLWLTATGHVISWKDEKNQLTEVAAADQPLSPSRHLLRHKLKGERADRIGSFPGLNYQTCFHVETLSPELFRHVEGEIRADGGTRGLLCSFAPHHRLSQTPIGAIVVDVGERRVSLATFHTFPDECAVVKTQTLIERLF